MHDSLTNKETISVVGCEIRDAREGGSEICINHLTKIESSLKKFSTLAAGTTRAKNILINDLASLATDQLVTVMVKAIVIDAPETVTNRGHQLTKQDCIIGDSSGNGRVVLWEQDVGKMEETKSYKLVSVEVKSFKGNSYFSFTSESEIIPINDIGETTEIIEEDLKECGIVKTEFNGEIDIVTYADEYQSCINCNSK